MDELTREFLIESQEGLDRMERCMTDLEERPNDTGLLAEIFRSVHTIKGTTGFLGFKRLEKLAHAGENLLGLLREGKMVADGKTITGLLQLLDGLRSILKTIETEASEGAGEDTALIEMLEQLQAPAHAQSKQAVHMRAGAHEPPVSSVPASPEPVASPVPPAPTAISNPGDVAEAGVQATQALDTSLPDKSDAPKPRVQAGTAAESTLRVDVTLLNRMMNLVGELVLTRNQVLQATAADPNLTMLSRRLDMVTADLRESVMKARMQPVSNIFSKIPRIVRDLSQSLGCRVRL
jgi:two-component system chemotaxis sensor kinase CheA